jgi:transposase
VQDDCITVALGLPEVQVLRQHEEGHQITVEVVYRARSVRCPRCEHETSRVHSVQRQWKQDRRLWDKPVLLLLHKRRFRCGACGKVFTEPDPVFGYRR